MKLKNPDLDVIDLGRMPYQQAWDLQKAVQQRLIDEKLAARGESRKGGTRASTSESVTDTVSGTKSEAISASGAVPGMISSSKSESAPGSDAVFMDDTEHLPVPEAGKNSPVPAVKRSNDVLLFVEHPHVYTIGKSGNEAHLLAAAADLERIGATYVKIDRGGDITYHGPGQIVGYPILDLERHYTDIHRYLRDLEEVMIRVCADYVLKAGRIEGLTGVWTGDAKICAFGVKCSRWVTMHGFAFNVNPDLGYFNQIVPCGISTKQVTSLQQQILRHVDMEEVKMRITKHFGDVFGVNPVPAEKTVVV